MEIYGQSKAGRKFVCPDYIDPVMTAKPPKPKKKPKKKPVVVEKTKHCKKCNRTLPVSEFYFYAKKRKYNFFCKECQKAYNKEYNLRKKNEDKG